MRKVLLLFISIFFCCSLYAQQKNLSGIVSEAESGEPLTGVSVKIKGTGKGTVTDGKGQYKIAVDVNQVLEFSFLGMTTQQIVVKSSTAERLNIVMRPDQLALEDVVVVGYGVTKKRDLAGAITSLKPDNIQAGVVSDMSQFLKGRASGVQVRQNSLEPGGSVSVRVRGASSVSAENEPLYVIDGFQTDNMTQLNVDDIESIEILKDASTTAIYGARGANGVILITTKKGKAGQIHVEYSNSSAAKLMYNPWDLLDAGETIALERRLYEQDPTMTSSRWTAEQAKFRGKGTDWVKETTRNTITNLQQLSVSGGSDRITGYASANYLTEPGILYNTDYKRFGGRTNLSFKLSDRIRIGANLNFAQ